MACLVGHPLAQGEWKDGVQHGIGSCVFSDGHTFEGEWEDGRWVQSSADPERSIVDFFDPSEAIECGERAQFCIRAKDEAGNDRLCGGDSFAVYIDYDTDRPFDPSVVSQVDLEWCEVQDHGDGTYGVTVTARKATQCNVFVTIAGVELVAESPYRATVKAAKFEPASSMLEGSGFSR